MQMGKYKGNLNENILKRSRKQKGMRGIEVGTDVKRVGVKN